MSAVEGLSDEVLLSRAFLDRDRDARGDQHVNVPVRSGDAQPSRIVIELSPNDFAESLRITLDFGVGGSAVADDQRHSDSVAKPWDAA